MTDTNTDKTVPPSAKQRYAEAEGWFDDVLAVLVRSPVTLAAFVVWTLAAFAIGTDERPPEIKRIASVNNDTGKPVYHVEEKP